MNIVSMHILTIHFIFVYTDMTLAQRAWGRVKYIVLVQRAILITCVSCPNARCDTKEVLIDFCICIG